MGNEKVSDKEIQAAWNKFQGAARWPSSMGVPQVMPMVPNMMNSPMGFNMLNQPAPAVMPAQAQQLTPTQTAQLSAQQMMGMQMMQGNTMNNTQQFKTLGHNTKLRYGTPKVRNWGVCKDCGNFSPDAKPEDIGWCNAKQCRTHPTSGKVETEFTDAAGKKTKLIDSVKSCRQFRPIY